MVYGVGEQVLMFIKQHLFLLIKHLLNPYMVPGNI